MEEDYPRGAPGSRLQTTRSVRGQVFHGEPPSFPKVFRSPNGYGLANRTLPAEVRKGEGADMPVAAERPLRSANSEDGTTSGSRHRHPARHPIPGRTPYEVSSESAHPLSAGGIAAGARNGKLGQIRTSEDDYASASLRCTRDQDRKAIRDRSSLAVTRAGWREGSSWQCTFVP